MDIELITTNKIKNIKDLREGYCYSMLGENKKYLGQFIRKEKTLDGDDAYICKFKIGKETIMMRIEDNILFEETGCTDIPSADTLRSQALIREDQQHTKPKTRRSLFEWWGGKTLRKSKKNQKTKKSKKNKKKLYNMNQHLIQDRRYKKKENEKWIHLGRYKPFTDQTEEKELRFLKGNKISLINPNSSHTLKEYKKKPKTQQETDVTGWDESMKLRLENLKKKKKQWKITHDEIFLKSHENERAKMRTLKNDLNSINEKEDKEYIVHQPSGFMPFETSESLTDIYGKGGNTRKIRHKRSKSKRSKSKKSWKH
jgi:hypothetical protein